LGFFSAALKKLDLLDQHNPHAVFHRVTVFESQGDFGKAMHVFSTEVLSSSDSIEHLLLCVVKSYLQCLTKGLWLQGLQTAERALKLVALSPSIGGSAQVAVRLIGSKMIGC
jgi:hypothetical protein